MISAWSGKNVVAHEQQKRRESDGASKVQASEQILSGAFLPNDEEAEEGYPRDEQGDADYLSLLNAVRVVDRVEEYKDENDEEAEDCACTREDGRE